MRHTKNDEGHDAIFIGGCAEMGNTAGLGGLLGPARGDGEIGMRSAVMSRRWGVFIAGAGLFLSACAFDLAHVTFTATMFRETPSSTRSFVLTDEVLLPGTPCFSRSLRKHTRWDHVGTVGEGFVFRSKDQVLTLECSNVHEAYLVMAGNELVGFFLPVEQGFVPYSPATALPVEQSI